MFKKIFLLVIGIIFLLLSSCINKNEENTNTPLSLEKEEIVKGGDDEKSSSQPKIESVTLGEHTKTRHGFEVIVPLNRNPLPGKSYVIIKTIGDVSFIEVTVKKNGGKSQTYTVNKPIDEYEQFRTWNIEINLPDGELSLQTVLISSNGEKIVPEIKLNITTSNIDIKLSRSSGGFSPGPNTITANITNFGDKGIFNVSASDNQNIVQKQFSPLTLSLENNESKIINIPINISREIEDDIYDYIISIHIERENSKDINIATSQGKITKHPVGVADKYKKVILNSDNCGSISRNKDIIQVTIPGSEKLFLDDVDYESITWMNGKLKPLTVEQKDNVSFYDHNCNNIRPDGMIDLIMTFSLQDIIKTSEAEKTENSWEAYIKYNSKTGFGGEVLRFYMEVK